MRGGGVLGLEGLVTEQRLQRMWKPGLDPRNGDPSALTPAMLNLLGIPRIETIALTTTTLETLHTMGTLCLNENSGTETLDSGTETLASGTETLASGTETLAFI